MDYQVTLICTNGQYKPVSAIVKAEGKDLNNPTDKKELVNKGIQKICASRYWGSADLKRYSYTRSKIRVYDKEKIEQENKERYEAIKEAKYASGEWKRPKGKK
jgi:hypothetical protein